MKPGTMLRILKDITDNHLPEMLRDNQVHWNSLNINYHRPFVKRLWRQWGDFRILLHKIESCSREEALLHPHKWPSAIMVIDSDYEMGIGYGTGPEAPSIAATIEVEVGNGTFAYEMIDPLGWHYVHPHNTYSLSVMVIGKPWTNALPDVEKVPVLGPLSEKEKVEILEEFSLEFPFEFPTI